MKTIQQSHQDLANALSLTSIYLKREDAHPYGSHKGRSIPLMIKEYQKKGDTTHFTISSSGNAALAAAMTISKHNRNSPSNPLNLSIFVGQHIPEKKLMKITALVDGTHIVLKKIERPKQAAFLLDKEGTAKNLRQSTDDLALIGYESLAKELSKIPNLQAVFLPTSSGTAAQAVAQVFSQNTPSVQVHIVQTSACHPISDEFEAVGETTESSTANAIVDNVAHRKEAVVRAVKETGGSGWIASNEDISTAQKLIKQHANIVSSPNSALAVAGIQKAVQNGWKWDGAVVGVLTGE